MPIKLTERYITLVLTHQCNLSCSYCYECNKDKSRMSFEMAKKILDQELRDTSLKKIEIDFMGGEPLLEFDLIKEIVEYARKTFDVKKINFFITTNGTILTECMRAWLKANTDILQIGLSLDGNKRMQDINRSNSFDKIDLSFFRDTYPLQSIKMTVSKETLPFLSEGVIFAHELGFSINCNLAYGIDWSDISNQEILCIQLNNLIDYYCAHPSIKPCSMLDIEKIYNVSVSEGKNYRVCGAGWSTIAYDIDGNKYPCQFFLPLSIGDEKAKASSLIKFHSESISNENMCVDCLYCCLRNTCMTCYGANYATTGNIYQPDMNMCRLFKIQYKAIAYFAAKMFTESKITWIEEDKLPIILKSALLINENIHI